MGKPHVSIEKSVHYEIHARRGSGWTILAIKDSRQEAVATAENLWKGGGQTGLRIVKETFDRAKQEFSSVEIFSRGAQRKKSRHDPGEAISPCLTTNDLYGGDGRRSIWELLSSSLREWAITPTELLHSLEHYYRLYNKGTLLQNAVQRTAVAFEDTQDSIQERMRKITKLVDTAADLLKAAEPTVPKLELGRLKPVTLALEGKQNRSFLLLASLSEYLRPTQTLYDKFGRILVFVSGDRPQWVTDCLDQLVSEYFLFDGVVLQLFNEPGDRGVFLNLIVHLYAGDLESLREDPAAGSQVTEDALSVNAAVQMGLMPQTRKKLLKRLAVEIDATQAINDRGLYNELQALAVLRTRLGTLGIDEGTLDILDQKLEARASRMVNSQSVGTALDEHADPFDKLFFLLKLEAVTPGLSNKRMVANSILPILTRPDYESALLGLNTSPVKAMPRLAQLQKAVLQSGLTEMHQRQISEKLDSLCRAILENTRILERIHQAAIGPVDKVLRLLQLMADEYFTQGTRERAEHLVLMYMRQETFAKDLSRPQNGRPPAEIQTMLWQLLETAGLKSSAKRADKADRDPLENTDGPTPSDGNGGPTAEGDSSDNSDAAKAVEDGDQGP